jgi:hypothetical protein
MNEHITIDGHRLRVYWLRVIEATPSIRDALKSVDDPGR